MTDKALAAVFLTAITALLIGGRFAFGWAGGAGYDASLPITVTAAQGAAAIDRAGIKRDAATGERIARGEWVRSGEDGYRIIAIQGVGQVGLAERTDLLIQAVEPDRVTIFIKRGRIMAQMNETNRKLTLETKNTQTTLIAGALALINYDFKETVEIAPFGTTVAGTVGEQAFLTDQATIIHEVPPITIEDAQFNPTASAGAAFYEWFTQNHPN